MFTWEDMGATVGVWGVWFVEPGPHPPAPGLDRPESAREHGIMRIVFGTDEATGVTEAAVSHLRDMGHDVTEVPVGAWASVGRAVGEAVAAGEADRGVLSCWTGTGVSIAANKVPGIRAALCTDAETARGSRLWNDANVLVFGLRLTSETVVGEMLDAFLETDEIDESELDSINSLEPPVDQL